MVYIMSALYDFFWNLDVRLLRLTLRRQFLWQTYFCANICVHDFNWLCEHNNILYSTGTTFLIRDLFDDTFPDLYDVVLSQFRISFKI
jgi:hypothetical protein